MVTVPLLKLEPELAAGIPRERLAAAVRACRARVVEVRNGAWDPTSTPIDDRGFGLLVLSGALYRRVEQSECFAAELIGPGDLLRPWDSVGEWSTLPVEAQFAVLERTQLALLDLSFARRAGPFPEIAGNLAGRALQRARYLAITSSIVSQRRVDKRLVMLFWNMADRFGQTRADGVYIPLPLTHRIISELIAARRPSVTTSLSRLHDRGVLSRERRGWLLTAERPPEGMPPAHPSASSSSSSSSSRRSWAIRAKVSSSPDSKTKKTQATKEPSPQAKMPRSTSPTPAVAEIAAPTET